MKLGELKKLASGVELIDFEDQYGEPCSLQQTDVQEADAPATLWLGVDGDRMCLDFEQVKALSSTLNRWAESGSFVAPK